VTSTELLQSILDRTERRFYGKHAGTVVDVEDPLEIGRLRAMVPSIFGEDDPCGWALPCAPFGGGPDRGFLMLPEVGDSVWIEFAAGDLRMPIWSGVFWGAPSSTGSQDDLGEATGTELPTADDVVAGPQLSVIRTAAGHRLFFDDEGEIVVLANGNDETEIRLNADGEVIITAEKIQLGVDGEEPLVLGDAFKELFNNHIHPTGVGPSGQPTEPLGSSHLSDTSFTE
jgi:hypothetical protein